MNGTHGTPGQGQARSGATRPDLHALLLELGDNLHSLERTIRQLAQRPDAGQVIAPQPPDQYAALETAIGARRRLVLAADLHLAPGMVLRLDPWRLEDEGWVLALDGTGRRLLLTPDERTLLILIAQAPAHCISADALRQALGAGSFGLDSNLARQLRRKARAAGGRLALTRRRDGSFHFRKEEP